MLHLDMMKTFSWLDRFAFNTGFVCAEAPVILGRFYKLASPFQHRPTFSNGLSLLISPWPVAVSMNCQFCLQTRTTYLSEETSMNGNNLTRLPGSKRNLFTLLASTVVITSGCANMATTAPSSNVSKLGSHHRRQTSWRQPARRRSDRDPLLRRRQRLRFRLHAGRKSHRRRGRDHRQAPVPSASARTATPNETPSGNTFSCPLTINQTLHPNNRSAPRRSRVIHSSMSSLAVETRSIRQIPPSTTMQPSSSACLAFAPRYRLPASSI